MRSGRRLLPPIAHPPARGVAAVEFGLVAALFFTALLGAVEMARIIHILNTTVEATRLGARIAVVCDPNSTTQAVIQTKVRAMLPSISPLNVNTAWQCTGSGNGSCTFATVQVAAGSPIQTFIPFVPLSLTLPSASTTLPVESLNSVGGTNPTCQ